MYLFLIQNATGKCVQKICKFNLIIIMRVPQLCVPERVYIQDDQITKLRQYRNTL